MDEIPKKPTPLPSHCDTPLTLNNVRKALLRPAPGQYINPHNPCKKEYTSMKHLAVLRYPEVFELSKFQYYLLQQFRPSSNGNELTEYRQCHTLASELFQLQVDTTLTNMGVDSTKIPLDLLLSEGQLQLLFLRKAFFAEAVVMSSSNSVNTGTWWKRYGDLIYYQQEGMIMICGRNLFVIQTAQLSALTSRDHLTIMSDLAAQRFSLHTQSILSVFTNNSDCPTPAELSEFLVIGDTMLAKGGNKAYDLVYTLEASCVSRLTGNYEGGTWKTSRFREKIQMDQLEKAQSLGLSHQLERREQLLTQVFERNVQALSQLYGLYRIWGHPTLEPLKGVISLKAKGLTPRRSVSSAVEDVNNHFKEEFIKRYITHHHEWPELDVSELSRSNLIRSHYERKLQYPDKLPRYKRSHLSLVKFKKIFPVDPKFDLIEFIDDKALSLGITDLIIEITQNKSIGSSLTRSLLLAFLRSDISDPEEFLNQIDIEGFPIHEICVGVHEKEREGKLIARLFGLLTIVKRSYVVLTEKLIADHLFPYFPEITMTDDEKALETKRLTFTKPKASVLYASLDFSKWNTNMRDLDTRAFFECLDQLFGFNNCFTRTHEMFYDSALYLIDGSYIPEIAEDGQLKEGLGCWRNHLGGIEGLRQKGWTLWTVSLIMLVAIGFDFKLRIMGQGDNQMLSFTFPEMYEENVQIEQVNRFIQQLDDILSIIGPPLKTEETWISRDFYLYGKYPILNGTPLTMSWKRSCRLFWCCNEDYPTIESSLSSLAANLFSAVASDNRTQVLYYVYLFECIGCFQNNIRRPYLQPAPFPLLVRRNPQVKLKTDDDLFKTVLITPPFNYDGAIQPDLLYRGLMLCPRTLGGYPVVLYPSILVKGFPDQLSYDIATLSSYYTSAPEGTRLLIQRILNPYLSSHLNYDLLAMNPEVINLETTSSPSEARRGIMIEFLKHSEYVQQPYVKQFLKLIDSRPNKQLIEFLSSPPKIHPKILNVFIQATAEYRAQQVVGKLQKTPTMARLYQREGDQDLYKILERSELNHFKAVLRAIFNTNLRMSIWDPALPSVHYATQLRQIGWRKQIVGVDCAPPHEIFKLEQVDPTIPCDSNLELDKGFITIRVCASRTVCQDSTLIGPIFPYRGSFTKTKTDSVATKIKSSSPSLLKRAITLAELKNWVFFDNSKLDLVARGLLECITDTPYDLLTPESDQVSGSAQHRLRVDRVDNGGTSPNLPTQSTKLQLDTSTYTQLTKGGKNVNFMFQSPLVMVLVILGEALLEEKIIADHGSIFHLHVKNSQSILPLDEDPPDYENVNLNLEFTSYPDSPYLYFPYSKIQPYIRRTLKFIPAARKELNPESLPLRFHSLFAYDSHFILDSWSWTSDQSPRQLFNGVTINWALNCDIVLYVKILTRLLIVSFVNLGREIKFETFFQNLISILRNSPSESWENLTNLSFHPDYPFALYRSFNLPSHQTNETLTPYSVGDTLRHIVLLHIIQISNNPGSLIWENMEIWAPPSITPVLHPYRVIKILEKLSEGRDISIFEVQQLREEIDSYMSHTDITNDIIVIKETDQVTIGITSESLDFMCKTLPPIPVYDTESSIRSNSFQVEDAPHASTMIVSSVSPLTDGRTNYKYDHLDSHTLYSRRRSYKGYYLRPAPLPTSGSYKLLSLISHMELDSNYKALCVADGTGGFTRVFAQDHRCKEVWYNSIVKEEIYVPQMSPIPYVPDLTDLPSYESNKLKGLNLVNAFPSDITLDEYPDLLKKHITSPIDIITGDAESTNLYNLSKLFILIRSYARISMALEIPQGIFKIHHPDPTVVSICLHILFQVFSRIDVMRSHFSLDSNREVYLLCTKRRTTVSYLTKITDNSVICGGVLAVPPVSNLESKYSRFSSDENYKKLITTNLVHLYTTILTRHISLDSLRHVMIGRYPWIQLSFFKPISQKYKYPDILYHWYRKLHRPLVEGNQSVKSRIRLNQFSNQELISIASSYIFQRLISTDPTDWDILIPSILRDAVLIWLELENGEWTFMLYNNVLPPPLELEHTRVYGLAELISHTMIQKICRDVGLATYLGLSPPSIPKGLGFDRMLLPTTLFKRKIKPLNIHLNTLLYDTNFYPPSTWKLYSHINNFRTLQSQRILSRINK